MWVSDLSFCQQFTVIYFQSLKCFKYNLKALCYHLFRHICKYAAVSCAISVNLLSLHLSACHNSVTSEHTFIKFDIVWFYGNLSIHSSFGWSQATIMGTLYGEVHAFLHIEVNGGGIPNQGIPVLGIPSQPDSHVWESSISS